MAREIQLTKGQVAIVDDEDYDLLNQRSWYAHRWSKSGVWYAYAHFTISPGKHSHISMHHILMQTPRGMKTDHRDGNGLNNRRENLRLCTHAENMRNRAKRTPGSSKYKGVNLRKGRWRAYIQVNKKTILLGWFDNEADAALAYNVAAIKHHGEFARLNEVSHRG